MTCSGYFRLKMATFHHKLNELEARLRAENEDRRQDRVPTTFTLNSPTPVARRPRPFDQLNFGKPPGDFSRPVLGPADFDNAFGNHNSHDTPANSQTEGQPQLRPRVGLNLGPCPPPPGLNLGPRCGLNLGPSPSPPGLNLGAPSGLSLGAPCGLNLGPSPGSPGSLNVPPPPARRRGHFQLPCSPQSPQPQKPPDSAEIEQKYKEIMKQTGIISINGEKVRTDIGDLEPLGELGQGTCGHVVKMRHRQSGHVMAVKQMRRSGNREENKRIIMDLDVVIKSHSCPYIVRCVGTYITSSDVWICMELMDTCLEKLLKRIKQPFPERILGKISVATVSALNYLKEEHGVIHRDVKPSNILLDSKGRIKLCDFGISGRLVDSKAKTRSAGCAAYMAPERIDPPDPTQPDYDIRADVWSLGISLVELATGEFPYVNCKTDFEVLTKVLQEEPPVLPSRRGFSMDFCSFVSQCLTKDYRRRPKYKRLMEHNFIRRYTMQNIDVATWYKHIVSTLPTPSPSPPTPGYIGS